MLTVFLILMFHTRKIAFFVISTFFFKPQKTGKTIDDLVIDLFPKELIT